MPEKPQVPNWFNILLRHFTTFLIIIGGVWWLATPRVEAFIMQTVEARFALIESMLRTNTRQLQEILRMLREDVRNEG